MRDLIYISDAEIPSKKAHSIQQIKMCQSFSNAGYNVEFISPKTKHTQNYSTDHLRNFYGSQIDYDITQHYGRKVKGNICNRLLSHTINTNSKFLAVIKRIFSGKLGPDDIIYSRSEYCTLVLCKSVQNLPQEYRPKLVYEHHNPSPKIIEKVVLEGVDGCVFITKKLKDQMRKEYQLSDTPLLVAHDGVDIHPYEINNDIIKVRKTIVPDPDDKIIMYTGHLYKRKGVDLLLKEAPHINGQICIVGGYKNDIERLVNKYKNIGNVYFTGFIKPEEIHKYQLASDLLIAPYTNQARMPSPLKIFEYMAAKKPIISSDIPTIREVLTHRKNSYLFEAGSHIELRKAINKLSDDNELMCEISNQAFIDVKNYTWDSRAKKIKKYINKSVID